jgi:ubiquinol-cytochrome c reductase cytochrome c1 subunit
MKINVLKSLKRFALIACMVPGLALSAGAELHLDKAPVRTEQAALHHGAKLFVNYCLSCHAASFMRFNSLEQIGLSEAQIRDNLMFTGERVGDLMKISMRHTDGKAWFGATPPDLTLIARQRASEFGSGADWLYTYLRQFYRDANRPTGWNNVVFENVGMPHVLWELQGELVLQDGKLVQAKPGKLSPEQYDEAVADLVSFLVWMGEPVADKRKTIGTVVLIFLVGMFFLTYALKKNYWRDVH